MQSVLASLYAPQGQRRPDNRHFRLYGAETTPVGHISLECHRFARHQQEAALFLWPVLLFLEPDPEQTH